MVHCFRKRPFCSDIPFAFQALVAQGKVDTVGTTRRLIPADSEEEHNTFHSLQVLQAAQC